MVICCQLLPLISRDKCTVGPVFAKFQPEEVPHDPADASAWRRFLLAYKDRRGKPLPRKGVCYRVYVWGGVDSGEQLFPGPDEAGASRNPAQYGRLDKRPPPAKAPKA